MKHIGSSIENNPCYHTNVDNNTHNDQTSMMFSNDDVDIQHENDFNMSESDRSIFDDDISTSDDSLSMTSSSYTYMSNMFQIDNIVEPSLQNQHNDSLHPFEALSLKFFVDNSIPITLFSEYLKLFFIGKETNYNARKIHSYSYFMNRIKIMKSLERHRFVCKKFQIGTITHFVRVFPFLLNIKWLLAQKDLMENGFFQYDSTSTVYNELNTGYWWKNAESDMKSWTDHINNGRNHVLIPVILFIDKSHCSTNGSLNAEPVLVTIGNIPIDIRSSSKAWFNLGFIPQKTLTSAEREEFKKGRGTRSLMTEIYHKALHMILDEFLCINESDYDNNLGTEVYIHGLGKVNAHFEVAMIIGDSVGHDQLCCHYQGYSKEIQRPMRMCYCSYDQLDNPLVKCNRVIGKNIDLIISKCIEVVKEQDGEVTNARSLAQKHSQELYVSTLSKFRFGGDVEGVYGATPVECLHALLLGIMKYTLKSMFNYSEKDVVKENGSKVVTIHKLFITAEFERRIRMLSTYTKRQSDRHLPRSSFKNGVCTLAGLSGQEYIGLSLLSIVALPGCFNITETKKKIETGKKF